MKKILTILISFVLIEQISIAKDILLFDFPNEGWHRVESPDGIKTKKCYIPVNQTTENYNEMLVFSEKIIKNEGINAMVLMHKQLGKDHNNYPDILPQYIVKDENNAMAAWCSKLKNICEVKRTFQGKEGIIFVDYINKMPHYSQNILGQWSNILGRIEIYDKLSEKETKNKIELD